MIDPERIRLAKSRNLLELLPKNLAVKPGQNGYKTRCQMPGHDDDHPSMSLYKHQDGTWRYKCFGCGEWGDPIQYIRMTKGMTLEQAVDDLIGKAQSAPFRVEPEQVYDYFDRDGVLQYQVCRFPGKEFRCRNGQGKWDMCGVKRVLYRLPKLLDLEPGSMVYYVEGEKDVHTLERHGLVGTTHANGAGAFRAELLDPIKHLRVVVIPDLDEPGKQLMRRVYAAANDRKMSPGFILLSSSPRYDGVTKGWDVSDFFESGGTVDELQGLIK